MKAMRWPNASLSFVGCVRGCLLAAGLGALLAPGCRRGPEGPAGPPPLPPPPPDKHAIRGILNWQSGGPMAGRTVMAIQMVGKMMVANIKQSRFGDPAAESDAQGRFQILVDASECAQKGMLGDGPRRYTIALQDRAGQSASPVRDGKDESVSFSCAGQSVTELGALRASP